MHSTWKVERKFTVARSRVGCSTIVWSLLPCWREWAGIVVEAVLHYITTLSCCLWQSQCRRGERQSFIPVAPQVAKMCRHTSGGRHEFERGGARLR